MFARPSRGYTAYLNDRGPATRGNRSRGRRCAKGKRRGQALCQGQTKGAGAVPRANEGGRRCAKGKRRGQAHFSDLTFVDRQALIGRKMSQTPPP